MAGNDWNNLGRDVKDIVQRAIDTGDFRALNRDLGVTLENALGNVAESVKRAGKAGMSGMGKGWQNQGGAQPFEEEGPRPYGPGNGYSSSYSYRPFRRYRKSENERRMGRICLIRKYQLGESHRAFVYRTGYGADHHVRSDCGNPGNCFPFQPGNG